MSKYHYTIWVNGSGCWPETETPKSLRSAKMLIREYMGWTRVHLVPINIFDQDEFCCFASRRDAREDDGAYAPRIKREIADDRPRYPQNHFVHYLVDGR